MSNKIRATSLSDLKCGDKILVKLPDLEEQTNSKTPLTIPNYRVYKVIKSDYDEIIACPDEYPERNLITFNVLNAGRFEDVVLTIKD